MEIVHLTLGLLLAVVALGIIERRIPVPLPILLVFGGLGINLIPGIPPIKLDPGVFFLLFLPPLLFSDGWVIPKRELLELRRPILLLALVLVFITILTIGFTVHYLIPGVSLPLAFALGAIISPTDAMAISSITERLRAPTKLTTILKGESLINDATGLVAFKFALLAATTGTFSLSSIELNFLLLSIGGLSIGVALAWFIANTRRKISHNDGTDPLIEVTISLLTPFAAYLLAEHLGVSGILSVVAAGLYSGWRDTEEMTVETRIQASAVWQMVLFLLNGLAFILLGLQLPEVLSGLSHESPKQLAFYASVICGLVISMRIFFVFIGAYLPHLIFKRIRIKEGFPRWQHVLVIGWSGMRGTVTLAAALSIPLMLHGAPFPGRDMIIFLSFCVIMFTLVVQGMSLPYLIRYLKVEEDGSYHQEERNARIRITQTAIKRIEYLAETTHSDLDKELAANLISKYEQTVEHHTAEGEHWIDSAERIKADNKIRMIAIKAKRKQLHRLHKLGTINEEVLREIQQDIDLEESRATRMLVKLPKTEKIAEKTTRSKFLSKKTSS